MRSILFHLPLPGGHELPIPAYGTFLVLGMLLAVTCSGRQAERLGLSRTEVLDLGLLLVPAGVVGSHLLHAAIHPELYFRGDGLATGMLRLATLWRGGLVYYGGLAGGLLVLWLWSRSKGVPLLDAMDFVAPEKLLPDGEFAIITTAGVPVSWEASAADLEDPLEDLDLRWEFVALAASGRPDPNPRVPNPAPVRGELATEVTFANVGNVAYRGTFTARDTAGAESSASVDVFVLAEPVQ